MLPFKSIKDIELLENTPLGEGAFSIVYKVRHRATGRQMAMKKIDILQLSKADCENLKLEIKLHQHLEQANIIRFFSCLQHQNLVYMLLEHASNGSLFFYIDIKEGLPELLALRFFYETAKGINYLHSKGIVHRDIKPENILLDKDFRIKICDFGWSCKMEKDELRSSICGTYEYMSPEIVYEQSHNFGVDTWCLGVLLYEMLHGCPPFKADNLKQIKREFEKKHIEIAPHVSPGTKDLIERLLHYDSKRRISVSDALLHPVVIRNFKKITRPISKEEYELLIRYYYMNSGGNQLVTHNSVYARRLKRQSMLTESGFVGDVSGITTHGEPNKPKLKDLSIFDDKGPAQGFFDSVYSQSNTIGTDASEYTTMESEYSTLDKNTEPAYSNTYNVQDFNERGQGQQGLKPNLPSEAFKKKTKEDVKADMVTEEVMHSIRTSQNTNVKSGVAAREETEKSRSSREGTRNKSIEETQARLIIAGRGQQAGKDQGKTSPVYKTGKKEILQKNVNPAKRQETRAPIIIRKAKGEHLAQIGARLNTKTYQPRSRSSKDATRDPNNQTYGRRQVAMAQRGKPLLLRDSDERRKRQSSHRRGLNLQQKSKSPIQRKKSGQIIAKRNHSLNTLRLGPKNHGSAKLMSNVVMQRTTLKQFQDKFRNSKYGDQIAKDVAKLGQVKSPTQIRSQHHSPRPVQTQAAKTSDPQRKAKTPQPPQAQSPKYTPAVDSKTSNASKIENKTSVTVERRSNTPGLPSRITTTTTRGGNQKQTTEIRMISNQKTVIKYPPKLDLTSRKNMEMLTLRQKVQMKAKKGSGPGQTGPLTYERTKTPKTNPSLLNQKQSDSSKDNLPKETEDIKTGGKTAQNKAKQETGKTDIHKRDHTPTQNIKIESQLNSSNKRLGSAISNFVDYNFEASSSIPVNTLAAKPDPQIEKQQIQKPKPDIQNPASTTTQNKQKKLKNFTPNQSGRDLVMGGTKDRYKNRFKRWNNGLKVTDNLKMMRRVVIVNGVKMEKLIFSKQSIETNPKSFNLTEQHKSISARTSANRGENGDISKQNKLIKTRSGENVEKTENTNAASKKFNIVNSLNDKIMEERERESENESQGPNSQTSAAQDTNSETKISEQAKPKSSNERPKSFQRPKSKQKVFQQGGNTLTDVKPITVIRKGRFGEPTRPNNQSDVKKTTTTASSNIQPTTKGNIKTSGEAGKSQSGGKYRTVISLEEYRKRVQKQLEQSARRTNGMVKEGRERGVGKRAMSRPVLKSGRDVDMRAKSQTKTFRDLLSKILKIRRLIRDLKTNQNLKSTTNLLNRDLPKSENKTSKQTKKMYILPNQLPSTGNLEKSDNEREAPARKSNPERATSKTRVQNITNINNINIINNINNIKISNPQPDKYNTSFTRYNVESRQQPAKRSDLSRHRNVYKQTTRAKSSTVTNKYLENSSKGTSGRQFERVERLITWEEYQQLSKKVGEEISNSKRNVDLSAKRNAKPQAPAQKLPYTSNVGLDNSQKRDEKIERTNPKTVTYIRNNPNSNLANFKSEKNQYVYTSQKASQYGVNLKYATTTATGQGVEGYRVKNSPAFGYKHFKTEGETSQTRNKQA